MKRILLKLQYDGTDYQGFQIQNSQKKTIQGEVEKGLNKLFNQQITIFGCSRTDAGVSAYEYYCHFDVETSIFPTKICFALNQYLPRDIQAIESKEILNNQHARFDVKSKTYVYSIYASEHILPLLDKYAVKVNKFPNTVLMQKASKKLIGTHDFAGFKNNDPSKKDQNTVRKINYIKFQLIDGVLNIYINGDGFLYNMVRIIVGTLLDIGYNKKPIEIIDEILETKDRQKAGKTMDSKGLKLYEVKY